MYLSPNLAAKRLAPISSFHFVTFIGLDLRSKSLSAETGPAPVTTAAAEAARNKATRRSHKAKGPIGPKPTRKDAEIAAGTAIITAAAEAAWNEATQTGGMGE